MADENENQDESVTENETPAAEEPTAEAADEAVAEAPAAEADAPVPVPEAEADAPPEPAAEEAASDEPAAEASDDPSAVEAADEPAADAAEPTTGATTGPKPKKKRLPRAQRPQRTRPKRVKSAERKPMVRLEKPEPARGRRQERQGTVVSDAMEKTIVVKVEVVKAHPKYKKVVRRSAKFHAHDEASAAKVGDVVRIVETRPLSKTKRWRLAEVVEAAK